MQLESARLQGVLEEERVGMWQQQVLDTVQVGLQQGDTGDVRKLIAGAPGGCSSWCADNWWCVAA